LFDSNGTVKAPTASLDSLPADTLLTLGMNVVPSWLVAPSDSLQDLDNIKFEPSSITGSGTSIEATYELTSILIEGHARDITLGGPPRGMQLLLGNEKNPRADDTIVMANLGYFQFKSNPGYWRISLQQGRSRDIFEIASLEYDGVPANETEVDH